MIKVILSGCCGRMGYAIREALKREPDRYDLVAGFDLKPDSSLPFPVYQTPSDFPGTADVLIDFSHPSALAGVLQFVCDRKIPAVIATTGLSETQREDLEAAANITPIFVSANMSLGINLLIDLVKKATAVLRDYDIELIEKHHNQKLDAPSGTALMIADAISSVFPGQAEYVYDRHSVRRKRDASEIGIHSIRGGTIVGEHEVLFAGQNELLEIKHTATSRDVFASGAVRAAEYLVGKPAGLYHMDSLVSSITQAMEE